MNILLLASSCCSLSPFRGEGWGEGLFRAERCLAAPHPDPLPAGEREQESPGLLGGLDVLGFFGRRVADRGAEAAQAA
ncbi:MAG: hypothetical protein EOO66_26865 [Methylobacterium sp.]|nr:MAG: hypothetical protein EOO66_26865 [Methylobacterium sp.]